MKILFRVDAGGVIGLGHFFRSFALANELELRGHEVVFICKYSEFWMQTVNEGFNKPVHFIEENKSEYDFLSDGNFNLLFVDGSILYTEETLIKIRSLVPVIMYQNLTESRFKSDIYILPSIHQDEYFFTGFSEKTEIYVGLKYFTFNEVLKTKQSVQISKTVKKIGVSSGGSDPKNVLLSIYDLISSTWYSQEIYFVFFYGKNFMHKAALPETNTKFQIKEFDLDEMVKCDIVISAFGVTTYELLYLGVPIIAVGHQKSTSSAANFLAEFSKAFISLGNIESVDAEDFRVSIERILKYEDRISLSNKAKALLDLNGLNRIADIIESAFYET